MGIMEVSNHSRLRSSFIWLLNKSFAHSFDVVLTQNQSELCLPIDGCFVGRIYSKLFSPSIFSAQIKWKFCGSIVLRSVNVYIEKYSSLDVPKSTSADPSCRNKFVKRTKEKRFAQLLLLSALDVETENFSVIKQ